MTRCVAKTKAGKRCRCAAAVGGTVCAVHAVGPVTEAVAVVTAEALAAAAMSPTERCRAGLCDHMKLFPHTKSPCRTLCDRGLCDHGKLIPYSEWTGHYPMGMHVVYGSHGVYLRHWWEK